MIDTLPVKNKGGRPLASTKTETQPGPRMQALLRKHGVKEILKAIEDRNYLADNFSSMDAMLIKGLGDSIAQGGQALENALNRMFGKVPDKAINLNLNIDATPQQLSDRAQALLDDLDPQHEPVAIESEAIEDDHSDLIDEG